MQRATEPHWLSEHPPRSRQGLADCSCGNRTGGNGAYGNRCNRDYPGFHRHHNSALELTFPQDPRSETWDRLFEGKVEPHRGGGIPPSSGTVGGTVPGKNRTPAVVYEHGPKFRG